MLSSHRCLPSVEEEGRYVAEVVPGLAGLSHIRESGQHLLLMTLAETGGIGAQCQGVDAVTESHGSLLFAAPALQRL